jgi:hypothetical protein
VDDVHRKPKDDERDEVAARIKRAAAAGRISDPDRDIRLGNVRSAQSMWELDLITRELDQLEAVVSPAPQYRPPDTTPGPVQGTTTRPAYTPVTGPASPPVGSQASRPAGKRTGGAAVLSCLVVLVVAVVVVGVVVVVGFRTIQGLTQDAVQEATEGSGGQSAPGAPEADPGAAGAKYALTTAGIRGFLQAYRKEFGTNRVVDLTLYGDYAIVNVPKAKSRQESWIYREVSGFATFGGVRATFPGARPVATSRLAVPALVRNIARARTTLNVEKPTQTYVIVRFVPGATRVPSVNIYVGNKFNESGYLATTLAGKVQSAYPFRRQ